VTRVSLLTLCRVFWRSLFLQASWNPRGMQNLGFASAIAPALKELYPDPQKRAEAARRHLEFFNCHPYMAAAILGGAVRLEERVAAGIAQPEYISQFKRALGPPFAALGDGFFWLALRPATALMAAVTVPFIGLWSVALFLVLYNSVHLVARVWMFRSGYTKAEGVVEDLARAHYANATPLLKGIGAALAGAMAARAVLAGAFGPLPGTAFGFAAIAILAWFLLPRLGVTRAAYVALLCGLALGARFL
jgi:PTS system mannose-specific IID component